MNKMKVIIAGLSPDPEKGKMALLIARAIAQQEDMELYPSALSEDYLGRMHIDSSNNLHLFPIEEHRNILNTAREEVDVLIDATQPHSVNRNAELYCWAEIPFVMITTGGDRDALVATIKGSRISALLTVNAAAHVVAVQEMVRFAANNFPGLFKGFSFSIKESHQAVKPDPSGTAANLLPAFSALGVPYTKEKIAENMERDPVRQQLELGIPPQYLGGHGYHTYTLMSPDSTVKIELTHNILGRQPYINGILADARFVYGKKGIAGQVFTQVDQMRGQ